MRIGIINVRGWQERPFIVFLFAPFDLMSSSFTASGGRNTLTFLSGGILVRGYCEYTIAKVFPTSAGSAVSRDQWLATSTSITGLWFTFPVYGCGSRTQEIRQLLLCTNNNPKAYHAHPKPITST